MREKLLRLLSGFDAYYLKTAFLNLALQGTTLVSKFILLFSLTRFLEPGDVGLYALMTTTQGFLLYILGADFYAFNTREILAHNSDEWARLIRDQFAFHALCYAVVLPLSLIVFFTGILPWQYAFWFYTLIVLEHFCQEIYRILVTLSRPISGSIVLFLRNGVWVYVLLVVMFLHPDSRNLTSLWLAWVMGLITSCFFSIYCLSSLNWRDVLTTAPDWNWIKKGLLVSMPLFVGTLALRGIPLSERYILQYFWGKETVGVYTFYDSLTNAVLLFVDISAISLMYPKIIAAYHQERDKYPRLMQQFTWTVIFLASLASLLAGILIYPVLAFVQRPIYAAHMPVYWILLVSTIVATLGYIPHCALYAKGFDRAILTSSITGFFVAVSIDLLLVPKFSMMGAAIATTIAITVMSILKASSLPKKKVALLYISTKGNRNL
jgi:O-antigen/teichoic acid export membrane protein